MPDTGGIVVFALAFATFFSTSYAVERSLKMRGKKGFMVWATGAASIIIGMQST